MEAVPNRMTEAERSSRSTQTVRTERFEQIDRARSRSVRLIISIPVLTLLLVLISGLVYYFYIASFAEIQDLSAGARQDLQTTALRMLQMTIGLSVLAAGVGYLLARQILRPIRQLSGTMEALASGDLSRKVQPVPLGEFGQLGATFNRMVEELNRLFEERDRQLRQSFSGVHLLTDRDGVVLQADSSVERLFGVTAGDLCGRNILHHDARIPLIERNPRLLQILVRLIHAGGGGAKENRLVPIRRENGLTTKFLISCMPLESRQDGGVTLLLIIRDAKEIASFYEQMQRADRLAAVGTLATGIAHEIRNPLASIRGMVQLLAEESQAEGEADNSHLHDRVLGEVDRLNELIEGIMSFGQGENSPPEPVDLNALMREAAEATIHRVPGASEMVEVEYDLDESLPKATLQVGRMRQALLNLAINAFEHCMEISGGKVRFTTLYLPVNQQRPIILCVANTGEPIEEGLRERCFEPFYTTKAQGTGLGLPITYQSVMANGGVLELECEEGEIQFWVRLPLDVRRATSAARILPQHSSATPFVADTHPGTSPSRV